MTVFFKAFVVPAFVAFAVALVAGVALLPGYVAKRSRTVEFATLEPGAATPLAPPVAALEAARAHARAHGLTNCVDPAYADLDDVILTVPGDPRAEAVVTPVGFDEALESGERDRWNVLACTAVDEAA